MLKRFRLLDSLIKYTVATILIAVPLYPKFPFIRIPGTFVAIRVEDLVLAFSGLLLILIIFPKLKEFLKDKLNQSIALFLSVGIISLLSAVFITQTVIPHIGFLHWARRIEYFIPFFLGMEAIRRDRKNVGFYLKILFLVVVFVFIYGAGQKYFSWPIIITQNEEYSKGVALRWIPGSHINSTFAGHYDLSTYLVLVLPIVVSSFFVLKGKVTKFFLSFVFLAGMWLMVNSASRVSLASYMVATFISLILVRKGKFIPIIFIITIIFVGFSSNLLERYSRLFDVAGKRIMQFNLINHRVVGPVFASEDEFDLKRKILTPTPIPVPVFEDRSTNIRLNVEWPRALRAFTKNPLLGTGYSSITLATDNDYLRLLGEVGLLGFFTFFLIFVNLIVVFLERFPLHKYFRNLELSFTAGAFGSLPGLFLNTMFIDIFEASKFAIIFWLVAGLSLSTIKYGKSE